MCGCLLHAPNWRPGPQPRHVPQPGTEPQPFSSQSGAPLSHASQGLVDILKQIRSCTSQGPLWFPTCLRRRVKSLRRFVESLVNRCLLPL